MTSNLLDVKLLVIIVQLRAHNIVRTYSPDSSNLRIVMNMRLVYIIHIISQRYD